MTTQEPEKFYSNLVDNHVFSNATGNALSNVNSGGQWSRWTKFDLYTRPAGWSEQFHLKNFVEENISVPSLKPGSLISFDIPQGTGEAERIGQKITIKEIQLRLNTGTPSATARSGADALRFMLICQKNADPATPLNINNILTNQDSLEGVNPLYRREFVTLFETLTIVGGNDYSFTPTMEWFYVQEPSSWTTDIVRTFDFDQKYGNAGCVYNKLYLYVTQHSNQGVLDPPSFGYSIRITFTDQ
jgi:hypothetical protein